MQAQDTRPVVAHSKNIWGLNLNLLLGLLTTELVSVFTGLPRSFIVSSWVWYEFEIIDKAYRLWPAKPRRGMQCEWIAELHAVTSTVVKHTNFQWLWHAPPAPEQFHLHQLSDAMPQPLQSDEPLALPPVKPRKRSCETSKWRSVKRKMAWQRGECYVTKTGKLVESKQPFIEMQT
jgi:hypothetical protein